MESASAVSQVATSGNLEEFYAAVEPMQIVPGWNDHVGGLLWPEPKTAFQPSHWRYSECREALDAAGRLIGTELAERRNLILRNPIPDNRFSTVRTIVNAYQMILPGEVARSHRHAPHALRVIVESKGSYSIVDGEQTPMETGDVVITPGWCWHGHGHNGDEPAYWIDSLDLPLTQLLEPMFVESHPLDYEPVEKVTPDSPYRFSWDMIQARLETAERDPEGYFGARIELDTLGTMPTMGLTVTRLESGDTTRPYRHTPNSVYCVMAGAGVSTVGGSEFEWARGDCFVAPCWKPITHRATADSVLFASSDEPLQRFARYYRFEDLA